MNYMCNILTFFQYTAGYMQENIYNLKFEQLFCIFSKLKVRITAIFHQFKTIANHAVWNTYDEWWHFHIYIVNKLTFHFSTILNCTCSTK